MEFATLPPETNSGLLYSGPGSRSMLDAAIAWDGLATRLYAAAAQCSSVTSKLTPEEQGSTTAHIAWLNGAAAQAERTAAQAKSAASAYELALVAMVPPAAIRANRMLWTWLAETNCLGQSSPAVADAESDYDQMWAQDVDTMQTYAQASADAAAVTPFASPPPAGAHSGRGHRALTTAPVLIAAARRVMSAIPVALDALSTSSGASLMTFGVTPSLSKLDFVSSPSDFAINHLNSLNKNAALQSAAMLYRSAHGGRGAMSSFGRAASIGTLSVPRGWIAKTPRPATPQRGGGREPMRLVAPVSGRNGRSPASGERRSARSTRTSSRRRRSP